MEDKNAATPIVSQAQCTNTGTIPSKTTTAS